MNPQRMRHTGTEMMIDKAFAKDQELADRLIEMIRADMKLDQVLADISAYILTKARHLDEYVETEPQSKKRKVLVNNTVPTTAKQTDLPRKLILDKEVSFAMPVRKKMVLDISRYGDANSHDDPSVIYGISAQPKGSIVKEFETKLNNFRYAILLPVPEKAQKQFNYCIIPDSNAEAGVEPLVWTINESDLGTVLMFGSEVSLMKRDLKGEKHDDFMFNIVLAYALQHHNIKLVRPSESEFVSAIPESHRKGEKAYHVNAHRGSKDGYLFFLETGIFFGFKKPLAFYALDEIESISYTSVLQRTFNLNIAYRPYGSEDVQEVEFSMLDQANFAGIDGYVKKHQLQDASMAEARRAKIQKANGTKNKDTNGDVDDHRTELEKGQQQLEEEEVDEEDELEEDYDPEAEDSDASGSGSDDDEYEYNMPTRKRNLVEEELSSEAEDVEITDEEGGEEDEDQEEADEDEAEPEEEVEVVDERPAKVHAVETISHSHPGQHDNGAPGIDDEDQL